jgi:hypothetical protein
MSWYRQEISSAGPSEEKRAGGRLGKGERLVQLYSCSTYSGKLASKRARLDSAFRAKRKMWVQGKKSKESETKRVMIGMYDPVELGRRECNNLYNAWSAPIYTTLCSSSHYPAISMATA